MQHREIKRLMDTIDLPHTYRAYPVDKAPALPWFVWYIDSESNFPADGQNYYNIKSLTVELYTASKDVDSETAIEAVLDGMGIWDKTETWVDSEQCLMTTYTLEV